MRPPQQVYEMVPAFFRYVPSGSHTTASVSHVALQPSPDAVFPSSHCSVPSTAPLPQRLHPEVSISQSGEQASIPVVKPRLMHVWPSNKSPSQSSSTSSWSSPQRQILMS